VQHDREWRGNADKFAIYLDVVTRSRLCTEIGANPSVDRHLTVCDQFIAISARPKPRSSEEAVEAHSCDRDSLIVIVPAI
jgi:hypothetical protein